MKGLFWKVWAILLVLSIFWLGWCIKSSPPAEAQYGPTEVQIVGINPGIYGTIPVDIKKVNGKQFGPLQVSILSPALPVQIEGR